jgi:uncharacterized membrane protein
MPTFRILVFQDVSLVGRLEVLKPANQQNSSCMETSNFAVAIFVNLTRSDTEESLHLYLNSEIADLSWYTIYKCFSLHFNTFKMIPMVQLMFLNSNY